MNQKDLKKYKKLLISEKEKIIKQIKFEKQSIDYLKKKEIGDIVDNAINMYEKTRAIEMSENEKLLLSAINDALLRIKNKRFGRCIKCGQEIDKTRLTAVPWALNCVDIKICNNFKKNNN